MKSIFLNKQILLIIFLFLTKSSFSQKVTKIEVINANTLEYDEIKSDKIRRLIGNVIFRHDSVYLYCDSAYSYVETNSIDAFSNVHIVQGDTFHLYCDTLKYNGDTKKGQLFNNIRLKDQEMLLTTQRMNYDMNKNLAYYFGGGKIVDSENILTSKIGHYYSNTKTFFFKDSVVLINPDYIMTSDTLQYNTTNEIAYFFGPTTITSEENIIYCENGWYDTKNELSQFNKNSVFENEEQQLKGDSLFYNRKTGFGQSFKNITLIDTTKDMIIYGDYAEYHRKNDSTFVVGNSLLINIIDDDSLFLHADTLMSVFDSIRNNHDLFAFHHVKFYKSDIQGACDSLVYSFSDSTMKFYKDPVLWSEESQLTADFITLGMRNNAIHTINMYNAAFIISQDTTDKFNQIKGKNMYGNFKDNKLFKMTVKGNGQSVYYAKEEDKYTGVNKSECTDMLLLFNENKADKITFITKPNAVFYPINLIEQSELLLKGFIWLGKLRPQNKEDVFKHTSTQTNKLPAETINEGK